MKDTDRIGILRDHIRCKNYFQSSNLRRGFFHSRPKRIYLLYALANRFQIGSNRFESAFCVFGSLILQYCMVKTLPRHLVTTKVFRPTSHKDDFAHIDSLGFTKLHTLCK